MIQSSKSHFPLPLVIAVTGHRDLVSGELIVPLPKPRQAYLQDFRTPESRQKFQLLCEQAQHVFELPQSIPPAPSDWDAAAWNNDYPYAQLGIFLCAHCHILLALWDGKPSAHLGGTAQVVKFHRDEVMPDFTSEDLATRLVLVHER